MPQNPEKGPGVFDLLSRFTQLRQSGHNRDDAWYRVCDAVPDMTEVTSKAFLALAKDWERREGHKYRYRDATTHATVSSKDIAAITQSSQQPRHLNHKPRM